MICQAAAQSSAAKGRIAIMRCTLFLKYRGPVCGPALQGCRIYEIKYLHNLGCQYDNKTLTRTDQP
jgi:hypothetical protein